MRLLIAGAGGHGRVVAEAADATGLWSAIAFLDDRHDVLDGTSRWPVLGRVSDMGQMSSQHYSFLAAFGDARLRLDVLARGRGQGFPISVLIHPRATVSPNATLGMGTVVLAGAVVNIGATLGVGCIVNTGATIDHDCRLADGVHVCPGAHLGGGVQIAERTWFGIGAVARQNTRIGADVVVGAGAVCVSDVRNGVTVVGVPAREHGPR